MSAVLLVCCSNCVWLVYLAQVSSKLAQVYWCRLGVSLTRLYLVSGVTLSRLAIVKSVRWEKMLRRDVLSRS